MFGTTIIASIAYSEERNWNNCLNLVALEVRLLPDF